MHFEITASQQAIRKPLTMAQRNSSLFAEAPRIGAVTLRRGQVLKFDEGQMKAQEVILKRLFDAGAIEIAQVDGGRRRDFRTEEVKMKEVKPEPKKEAAPPPPSAPKAPPVVVAPPPPVSMNEAFPTPDELVAAVAMENKETEAQIEKVVAGIAPAGEKVSEPSPSAPRPASSEKLSKKGRK